MSRKPPPFNVEEVIDWLPLSARDMDSAALARVQPEAQACLRAAAPRNRIHAREDLRALYLYLPWVLRKRGTLSRRTAWHPHTVDDYLDDIKGEYSLEWRQNHRIFLARVGRMVNPTGWPRKPKPLGRSPVAEAYSAAVEASYCLAAELRCLQQGTAAELFTVVGSFGAGMAGTEIADAEPCHIVNMTEDRRGILVFGEHERVAPIRAPYTRLAELALEVANGQPFIPKTPNPKSSAKAVYRAAARVAVKNAGHLSLPRARNTWLRAHLLAGTDLLDLERFSRPVKSDTLTALLRVTARDIDPMEAALRGLKA